MARSSRKEREIRERHELILDVARDQLLERGYTGLSMDRIAAATEYSKGTIYQHFPNKEAVVVALALETSGRRIALFEKAATFRGRPRERMTAIGEAADMFMRLYPDHFKSEQIVRTAAREKISEEQARQMGVCETRCMTVVAGIVRDGLAQGDLELSAGRSPQELAYGLWSMAFGVYVLQGQHFAFEQLGIADPFETLHTNQQVLLDGYGWRPFTNEWDYDATRERVQQEIFSEEARLLEERAA